MKTSIILLVIALVVVSADYKSEREKLDKATAKCQKDLGETHNILTETPKSGAQALCVNVEMGFMAKDGNLIPDKFKEHIERVTSDSAQQKLIIEECGKRNGADDKEAALNFVKCMKEHVHST